MPPDAFSHDKLVLQEFSRIRAVALCDLLGSSAADDLTAALASRETDIGVKKALHFALLEDFDHL